MTRGHRPVLIVGAVVAVLGLLYLAEARRYPWGTLAQPGPGVFPFLVGALLLAGAVGTALEAMLRRARSEIEWPRGPAGWRVLTLVVLTCGYILLLPYLGHPIAGSLVTFGVLQIMGLPRWWLRAGLAVAVAVASHYLFAGLLGVPLPAGPWFG